MSPADVAVVGTAAGVGEDADAPGARTTGEGAGVALRTGAGAEEDGGAAGDADTEGVAEGWRG